MVVLKPTVATVEVHRVVATKRLLQFQARVGGHQQGNVTRNRLGSATPAGVTEQPDMNFHRPSLKTIYCAYKTILNGLN